MSGPLNSNEIEDVVSSVRRLVSADQRPRVVSRDPGQDRLILTPALRVVADNAPPIAPLILTGADLAEEPAEAAAAPMVEAEWEEQLWSAPEPPLAELALGAEEAELVADPVAGTPAAAGTIWPEEGQDEAPWAEVEADWEEEPPIPFPAFAARAPAPDAAGEHSTPDEPEETGDPEDAIDVAEVLTAAVVGDESFHVMDEDELHVLVRSLVREELQGNLGERITRNVRKLVRAEVNRALAARALE